MRTSIRACKAMNNVFKAFFLKGPFKAPALGIRENPESYSEWEFQNAARTLVYFKPHDDIENKTILDIGCGLGGKSTYYALNGAKYVNAIDIDKERIEAAKNFAEKKKANNIDFEHQDATTLPFAPGRFDLVLFNDSFEHINNLRNTLKECYRVLRREGTVNILFPPYASPWGAHLFAYISIPWVQFLFSEEVLLSIWKEAFNQELKNGVTIYSQQKIEEVNNARSISELAHLNKMSIKQYEKIIKELQLNTRLTRFHTPGNLFSFFTRFSFLREFIVTRLVTVLEK